MTLPARAAAIRGDDYQHIIGWYWACRALTDPDIISVSIEDATGGAFDDLVILRSTGADCYYQIKSSNTDKTVVDAKWFTTATAVNGKSPLQHFHNTWAAHRHDDPCPRFQLITNRAFDPTDPILKLHDKYSNTVGCGLRPKTRGSAAGKQRKAWASHLGITETDLLDFLDAFELHHEGGETSWYRQARDAMRGAGLRDDDMAMIRGRDLVRDWVKTGAGRQTRDGIREQVAKADLLARQGTLILAVHAIDRPAHSLQPVVTFDFVDLYEGVTDRERRQLRNPDDWQTVVMPFLENKIRDLEAFGVRRVHIIGAMRLPMWFATGVRLPDVRGWVVSADQRNVERCGDRHPPRSARELGVSNSTGARPAVAIALTHDVTRDVETTCSNGVPCRLLLSDRLTPEPGGSRCQPAVGRCRSHPYVDAVRRTGALRLHLFFAAPAGAALMIGHHWNLLPPTTVYEHLGTTYAAAMTIR
jgi:hypothetical protein